MSRPIPLEHLGTAATVDGTRMMFTAACAAAIREEMERDERVFIMGEDIEEAMLGRTAGLFQQFGGSRVRNTPILQRMTATRMAKPTKGFVMRPQASLGVGFASLFISAFFVSSVIFPSPRHSPLE